MADDVIADLAQASALLDGVIEFRRDGLDKANIEKLQQARRLIDDAIVAVGTEFDVDVIV